MDLVTSFLEGRPSIYDVASYIMVVLLLIVVISMNLRQMKHARDIKALRARLRKLDGGAIRDADGRVIAYEDENDRTGWVIR